MSASTKVITIDSAEQPHQIRLTKAGHYRIEIDAEGADVTIKGGWYLRDKTQAAVALTIVHRARHTRSNTLLRGVAADHSWLQLEGTIVVEAGAQDTNAFLTENILLLDPTATAQAVPNLEIKANEVKCSHAATVSPIPEEYLFYLQSRGLTRQAAQDLIITGFLAEIS